MYRYRVNWVLIFLIIVSLSTIASFLFIDFRLKSSILEIAKSKAQIRGMETINEIVTNKVVSQIEYNDIVTVHKDEAGRIVLIQPNTIQLNKLMAETVIEVSKSLGQMENNTIGIPLGQLTGSRILSGYGPKIKVRTIPASQVNVTVLNKFEQAAINQSRHLIYFQIESTIKIVVPFMDDEVKVATTIPLAETIIVGEVPKTYVSLSEPRQLLNPLLGE